jgi:hypothetical protein
MKIFNEKGYSSIKCKIDNGENVLTMEKEPCEDIFLKIDKKEGEIEYDKEFQLDFDITEDTPEVFKVFSETYEDIKTIMEGFGNKTIDDSEGFNICSQEVSPIVGNYLRMRRDDKSIKLSFNTQYPRPGYDKDYGCSCYIPIRILYTSGMYKSFNSMYGNLIDAINKVNEKEKSLVLKPTKKEE